MSPEYEHLVPDGWSREETALEIWVWEEGMYVWTGLRFFGAVQLSDPVEVELIDDEPHPSEANRFGGSSMFRIRANGGAPGFRRAGLERFEPFLRYPACVGVVVPKSVGNG